MSGRFETRLFSENESAKKPTPTMPQAMSAGPGAATWASWPVVAKTPDPIQALTTMPMSEKRPNPFCLESMFLLLSRAARKALWVQAAVVRIGRMHGIFRPPRATAVSCRSGWQQSTAAALSACKLERCKHWLTDVGSEQSRCWAWTMSCPRGVRPLSCALGGE